MTTLASSSPNVSGSPASSSPSPRRRALLATLAGFAGVTAGAIGLVPLLDASVRLPFVAVGVFAAMSSIMVVTIQGHHPFSRFGPANRVTMVRVMVVALVSSLIVEPTSTRAAWTVVIMTAIIAVLDGVDGWLARRSGMTSVFGARFDMETDAFFMLVLSVLVWQHQKAGGWVVVIGLLRYAFVAGGWCWSWLAGPLRPTLRGKTVAIAQLVILALAIVPQVPRSMSGIVCAIALVLLTWSFGIDIARLWRQRAPRVAH